MKREFFCLVRAENSKNRIRYQVTLTGETDDDFIFDSEMSTLDGEKYHLESSSIGGIVRRQSELKLAA